MLHAGTESVVSLYKAKSATYHRARRAARYQWACRCESEMRTELLSWADDQANCCRPLAVGSCLQAQWWRLWMSSAFAGTCGITQQTRVEVLISAIEVERQTVM